MLLFIIAKTLLEIQILALCRDRVKMSRAEVRREFHPSTWLNYLGRLVKITLPSAP